MASTDPSPDARAATQLEASYQVGDFAGVRQRAGQILTEPGAAAEQVALARSYLARVQLDRGVWVALGFAALLFCAIVWRYGF